MYLLLVLVLQLVATQGTCYVQTLFGYRVDSLVRISDATDTHWQPLLPILLVLRLLTLQLTGMYS